MPMHTTPQKRLFQTPSEILVHRGVCILNGMAHTLSVYPHRASLKNMPGHGGNRLLPQNCWQQQLESIVATELATQNPDFLVFPMIFQ
jgi:hypothetical protein